MTSQPPPLNAVETSTHAGVVYGQPRVWLRLEGVAAVGVTVAAYAAGGHSWVMFGLVFFLPDLSFLAYLAGPRFGAVCYNCVHNYAVPVAMGATLHLLGTGVAVPLVWAAHVGFDRVLGYGLKYPDGFGHTHLGVLGRRTRDSGAT